MTTGSSEQGTSITDSRARRTGLALSLVACLATLSCATVTVDEGGWVEVAAPHFTIVTDGDPQRAMTIARELEGLRRWAVDWTGVDANAEVRGPRIYLFRDYASFELFEHQLWSDGYFIPSLDGGAIAINSESGERQTIEIANHELTHYLLWSSGRRDYPVWYHEGLAGLLSTAQRDGEVVRVGRLPASLALGFDMLGEIAIEDLLSSTSLDGWYGGSRLAFYARSWALVHLLRIGSEVEPPLVRELDRYLGQFRAGQGEDEALLEAFGFDAEELNRRLDRSIEMRAFREIAVAAPVAKAKKDDLSVRSLSEGEAVYQLFELAAKLGPDHRSKARALLARVLELEPDNARGLAMQTFFERNEKEEVETSTAFERAIALAPDDPVVRNIVGRYLLERAEALGVKQREAGEEDREAAINAQLMRQQAMIMARIHIGQSVALDPGSPEGFYLQGVASLLDGDQKRLGRESLETARRLAPWSAEVALRLGEINLRSGRIFRARRLFESVLSSVHAPEQVARARELLASMGPKRGGSKGEPDDFSD